MQCSFIVAVLLLKGGGGEKARAHTWSLKSYFILIFNDGVISTTKIIIVILSKFVCTRVLFKLKSIIKNKVIEIKSWIFPLPSTCDLYMAYLPVTHENMLLYSLKTGT